mmetsp:Transcript_138228/g.240532  ORF Transcript_138228/g.240532 Transcript_138228/m.240532 type:complete len:150 (+) Transcript_138228:1307-1756(+)
MPSGRARPVVPDMSLNCCIVAGVCGNELADVEVDKPRCVSTTPLSRYVCTSDLGVDADRDRPDGDAAIPWPGSLRLLALTGCMLALLGEYGEARPDGLAVRWGMVTAGDGGPGLAAREGPLLTGNKRAAPLLTTSADCGGIGLPGRDGI